MELNDLTLVLVGDCERAEALHRAVQDAGAELVRCAADDALGCVERAPPQLVVLAPSAMPEAASVCARLARRRQAPPRLLLLCPRPAAARLGAFRHAWIGHLDPEARPGQLDADLLALCAAIAAEPESSTPMRAILASLRDRPAASQPPPRPAAEPSPGPAPRDVELDALELFGCDPEAGASAVPPSVSDIAALAAATAPRVTVSDLVCEELSPWTDPPPSLSSPASRTTPVPVEIRMVQPATAVSPTDAETPSMRVCRRSPAPPATPSPLRFFAPVLAVVAIAGSMVLARDPQVRALSARTVVGSLHEVTRADPRQPPPHPHPVAVAEPAAPRPAAADSTRAASPEPPAAATARSAEDSLRARANAHIDIGHDLRKWGRTQRALEAYRKALALKPHYPRAIAGMVRAQLDNRDAAAAVRWARLLVKRKPNRAMNQYLLGEALALSGDQEAARRAYRQAARYGSESARHRLRQME